MTDYETASWFNATDEYLRGESVRITTQRRALLRRLTAIRKEQQRRIDAAKESNAREKWASR